MEWRKHFLQLLGNGWRSFIIPRMLVFFTLKVTSLVMFWHLYGNLRSQTRLWVDMRTMHFDHAQVQEWCAASNPDLEDLCERLAEQAALTQLRSEFHFDLFSYYTSLHFASISVAFWASIFAAACLIYLVKQGWQNSNGWVSTAFIAFSMLVAFYRGYPLLAKHDQNLRDNHILFLEHQNLVQEIRSFCATGVAHGTIDDLRKFIMHVDEKLIETNKIPLEFDATQIDVGSAALLRYHGVSSPHTIEDTP